jgi:hypothetical protein
MPESSEKEIYFTKHLFGAGIECPTKLYYYAHNYPENQAAVPFIKHAVYNKRLLKALARSIYPDGIFVDENSVSAASAQTKQYLEQQEIVLFNAVFKHQQMMGRIPIIHKTDNKLTAFHIQVKAFDSRKHRLCDADGNIYSKWRSYLLDFAYQLYLVKQTCPEKKLQAFLVMPEKSGRSYTDDLPSVLLPLQKKGNAIEVSVSNQQLLAKIEVSDLISHIWTDVDFSKTYLPRSTFEDSLIYLRDLYLHREKKPPQIGMKCKNCEFRIEKKLLSQDVQSGFNECWRPEFGTGNPSERHIFDLIGSGTQQRIHEQIYDQRDIDPDSIFSVSSIIEGKGRISHDMRQSLQIHKSQGTKVPGQLIRPNLFRELNRWKYPLHFLDFEAGNYAVPVRKNRSPYDLVVFQFSCHTLHQNGDWEHHQWIDDRQSGYPSYELIRQLMQVPDIQKGTIVQYSDFERQALKTIRRELTNEQPPMADADQLVGWIENIIHQNGSTDQQSPQVADLSRLVKHFYYNSEMEDSLSIKDVLQSVLSHSTFLKEKYSNPYSSHNFDQIVWWQPDGQSGARNPYQILSEIDSTTIRRGTEAMLVYGKLIAGRWTPPQQRAYRDALLKYCELDTLAMVMIYQHLQQEMHDLE